MTQDGAGKDWIDRLKSGDSRAAEELWNRYFRRLQGIARQRLGGARRVADEEDVALSALNSLYQGATTGRFPDLDSPDKLWRLLVTITLRKAGRQIEQERCAKRGSGRVRGDSCLEARSDVAWTFDRFAAGDLPPWLIELLQEQLQARLDSLPDDTLRRVALLKMDGYTNREIAELLDCKLRSVERKLNLIRSCWIQKES